MQIGGDVRRLQEKIRKIANYKEIDHKLCKVT